MGGPFHHPLLHLGGQGGAGQLNSLHAQGDDLGAFGELGQKGLPLPGQRPLHLGGGGVLRQPDLRQLCDSELAEGPQTLLIFRAGGGKMLLFQLAHAEQLDVDHGRTPYKMVRRKVDGRPARHPQTRK